MTVDPKKGLGQHFLVDENVSRKIVAQIKGHEGCTNLLEIGPGMGAITKYLLEIPDTTLHVMQVDRDSVAYLEENYPKLKNKIHQKNVLKTDFSTIFGNESFIMVGNFPYNISSQIFFKVLEYRNQIPEVVGMIQKEVAERIAAKEGNKTYGILSVLLQAFYDVEYLFSVPPNVFNPPPKVTSAVLRLKRNKTQTLDCDEKLFFRVVKQGFNNRRKTLRNALKSFDLSTEIKSLVLLDKRAEQLTVNDFVELTNHIANGES
jgi:16S rRNA (adenine1518-N6/adenine1519-N6)-dimethyltransferase